MAVRRSKLVLLVDRTLLRAGRPVEVQGRFVVEAGEPEEVPMTGIRLTLVQGDEKWDLGTADAGTGDDDLGHMSWEVRIPHGARSGPAVLVAGGARLRVHIDGVRHLDR